MSGNNNTTLSIIGLVSVAAIFGAYAYEKGLRPNFASWFGSGIVSGQMPVCESGTARGLLREAIDKSPRAIQSGLRISEIGAIKDYAEDPARAADTTVEMRFCQATVFTNGGSGEVHFVMKWVDPAKSRLWLETTVWTF